MLKNWEKKIEFEISHIFNKYTSHSFIHTETHEHLTPHITILNIHECRIGTKIFSYKVLFIVLCVCVCVSARSVLILFDMRLLVLAYAAHTLCLCWRPDGWKKECGGKKLNKVLWIFLIPFLPGTVCRVVRCSHLVCIWIYALHTRKISHRYLLLFQWMYTRYHIYIILI